MHLLERAAAPFFTDSKTAGKLAVGAVLSLIPVACLLSLGYAVAALEERLVNPNPRTLPEWRDPGRLFLLGVILFLSVLSYAGPAALLSAAAFWVLGKGFVLFPLALVLLVASAVLWLAVIFALPMAFALFLRRGRLAVLFDIGRVYRLTSQILSRYARVTLLNILLVALVPLPMLASKAGVIVSAPLAFVAALFLAMVYGAVCRDVIP